MRDALIEKGWREGLDLEYREIEGAGHNEAAWGARFGDVLVYLFPRVESVSGVMPEPDEGVRPTGSVH